MAMDFIRAIQAFTLHPEVPNSAIHYYAIVRRHFDLIKSGCYIAMTILSDGLIVSGPADLSIFRLTERP